MKTEIKHGLWIVAHGVYGQSEIVSADELSGITFDAVTRWYGGTVFRFEVIEAFGARLVCENEYDEMASHEDEHPTKWTLHNLQESAENRLDDLMDIFGPPIIAHQPERFQCD